MLRLLYIEDNDAGRRLLARQLRGEGFKVDTAPDGLSGVERARALSGQLDVILTDIQMPDITGLLVTRILKADPDTAHLPIIAVTAHVHDGSRADALAAGCDDYEAKPVNLPRLIAKVRALAGAS